MEVHNLTRTRREEQRFFLNTSEVFGIQSIQSSFENNIFPLKSIGLPSLPILPRGIQQGNFSLTKLLIDTDNFINLTGFSGFNGYILKNQTNSNENYAFTSGYLTSYNSKCGIGEIPEINANISVLGNLGRIDTNESAQVISDFNAISAGSYSFSKNIASYGSISINLNDFITNRVLSYDLSIDVIRNPIYVLGSRSPFDVKINWPIEITCSFLIDVNNYIPKNLRDFPCDRKIENLSILLKNKDNDSTIQSFTFDNMELFGETYTTNIEGNVAINATYKKFIGP